MRSLIFSIIILLSHSLYSAEGTLGPEQFKTHHYYSTMDFPVSEFLKIEDFSFIYRGINLNSSDDLSKLEKLKTRVIVKLKAPRKIKDFSVLNVQYYPLDGYSVRSPSSGKCSLEIKAHETNGNYFSIEIKALYPKQLNPFEQGISYQLKELRKRRVHKCIKSALNDISINNQVSLPVKVELINLNTPIQL